MKTSVILSFCVALALSASIREDNQSMKASLREQPAIEHQEEHDELGQYSLRYVTAEGTVVSAHGRLVPNNNGTGHVLITDGEYSYVGDDGKTYVTKYSAGLDGFQVEGDHLPKAPEPEPAPSSSVCVAAALCAVIEPSGKAALRLQPAVEHQEEHDELGQYSLRYVTAEGTVVSAHGRLVPNNNGTGHVLITDGEYSYVGDDGKTYVTKYSAGLDGFQVEGDHLPKAPEPEPAPSA